MGTLRTTSITIILLSFALFSISQNAPTTSETDFNWVTTNDLIYLADDTIITIQADGTLSRSTDNGVTWIDLTGALGGADKSGYAPAVVWVDWSISSVVFVQSRDPGLAWYTNDNAQTWHAVHPDKDLASIDFHGWQSDWIAATDYNDTLWVSKDLGETWIFVAHDVFYYTWGDAGHGQVSEDRLYISLYDTNDAFFHFVYTDDYGVTSTLIKERGYDFVFGQGHVFVVVDLQESNGYEILVSEDVGKPHKEFVTCLFPSELNFNSFQVVKDDSGPVFAGVTRASSNLFGSLFVSDATGARYDLSLDNVHIGTENYDFFAVWTLPGIFFANIGTLPAKGVNSPLLTKVTRDNGATWQALNPPHFDSNGVAITCSSSPCSLHLHGYEPYFGGDNMQFLISPSSAIGFALANGNVGSSLAKKDDLTNTYLSIDGGVTWTELKKGPSYYAMGGLGTVIVLADSSEETDTIYYTLDYGTTPLRSITLDQKYNVYAIRPTLTAKDFVFSVMVEDPNTSTNKVIGINFNDVYDNICDINSDFELWHPTGDTQEECFRGFDLVLKRRLAASQCKVNVTMDIFDNFTYCVCTADDWECDYNYIPDASDPTSCVPLTSESTEAPHYCPSGTQYNQTNGYRKEAGNLCVGGPSKYYPTVMDCPNTDGGHAGKKGWIAALIVVPFVLMILAAAITAMRSERVREALPFLKVLPHWTAGYSGVSQGGYGRGTSLMDDEDEENRHGGDQEEEEDKEFSIQADELEDQQIEDLNSQDHARVSSPSQQRKENLISIDDEETNDDDDFDPRK